MSQQIRVLQCIECKMYQVDLVKKDIKWECKICRQKQNVLKEFFRGSGPECRAKVQHMNLEHGKQEEHIEENLFLTARQQLNQEDCTVKMQENNLQLASKKTNKWANYVDKSIPVPQKSKDHHKEIAEVPDDLNDKVGIRMNYNRSKISKSTKRPAENVASFSNKTSKWSNYV